MSTNRHLPRSFSWLVHRYGAFSTKPVPCLHSRVLSHHKRPLIPAVRPSWQLPCTLMQRKGWASSFHKPPQIKISRGIKSIERRPLSQSAPEKPLQGGRLSCGGDAVRATGAINQGPGRCDWPLQVVEIGLARNRWLKRPITNGWAFCWRAPLTACTAVQL